MDTRRLGSKNTKDINNMIFKQGHSYFGRDCKHAKVVSNKLTLCDCKGKVMNLLKTKLAYYFGSDCLQIIK